jgi:RNA polymerase sigma factor (TIGR02999 family)
MSDVTRILSQIEAGDPSAADQLLPLVYEELRKLAAAEAMRRILIDNSRRKQRPKHGGNRSRIDLEDSLVMTDDRAVQLLALDKALHKLAAESPEKAELVKLRYFAGLSHQEAAHALGISRATADRYWAYAKVFLHCAMEDAESP